LMSLDMSNAGFYVARSSDDDKGAPKVEPRNYTPSQVPGGFVSEGSIDSALSRGGLYIPANMGICDVFAHVIYSFGITHRTEFALPCAIIKVLPIVRKAAKPRLSGRAKRVQQRVRAAGKESELTTDQKSNP